MQHREDLERCGTMEDARQCLFRRVLEAGVRAAWRAAVASADTDAAPPKQISPAPRDMPSDCLWSTRYRVIVPRSDLYCPVTGRLLRHAVLGRDGRTYDPSAGRHGPPNLFVRHVVHDALVEGVIV